MNDINMTISGTKGHNYGNLNNFDLNEQDSYCLIIVDASLIRRNPAECDLVLKNMQVSRRHAVIYRTPRGFVLRDMNSRNGTIFNGNFLRGDYLLQNMDTFCIGGTKIIFSNGIIIFNIVMIVLSAIILRRVTKDSR